MTPEVGVAFCPQCGVAVTAGSRYCAACGTAVGDDASVTLRARRPSEESIAVGEQRVLATLRELTLGEYEVLGELGRGGMAVVFLAHDIGLDRKVAIKVMAPALMLMDGDIQNRFKREARTAASLSHPHIIPVYGVREGRDLVYFVMKYVAGRSLESVIRDSGPLPIPMVQTVLAQAGGALGYAHRNGVVHRDVKPGNIMLDEEGWVVVTDFGIAKVAEQQALTLTGGVVGTPAYMSPEQCAGQEITGAADQYALGIVAYEMLTGRTPFVGGSMVKLMYDHCHEPPPPIEPLRPGCPPEVAGAVMRMLEKDPANRWPTIEDAVAAVGSVSDSQSGIVRTQLLTLAKQGGPAQLLQRFRTPRSPIPRTVPKAPRAETATAPGGSRRWLRAVLAMAAFAALATAASFLARGLGDTATELTPADAGSADPIVNASPALQVTQLDISPLSVTLEVGERTQLTVVATRADGIPVADPDVRWESSDSSIAAATPDGGIVGRAPGTTEARAHAGFATASVVVTVRAAPAVTSQPADPLRATSLELEPRSGALEVGGTLRLAATVLDQRGRPMRGATVRWSSSNAAAVAVSAEGVARAIGEGSAFVTAEHAGLLARAVLDVAPVPVAVLSVAAERGTIRVGETLQLTATPRDAEGMPLEGRQITWRSSDEAVASVTGAGVVRAVGSGTATITGTSGGRSGAAQITVQVPGPASTAPDPAVEVERLLEQYRLAIESLDVERLRRAYAGISPEQERAWREFFGNASNLSATFRILDVDAGADAAAARVEATYVFRSDQQQRQTVTFTASFERGSGGWRLTVVR